MQPELTKAEFHRIRKLKAIAAYAGTVLMTNDRAVRDAETGEVLGYWQTSEWVEDLLAMVKSYEA
jgi:hypothetical protein